MSVAPAMTAPRYRPAMSLPPPTSSAAGPSTSAPASARTRPTIELAGGLLVGAAVTVEVGAIVAAADSGFGESVSIGDFFTALGIFQLFVVTLVVLGVLLLRATRLLVPATMTTPGGTSRLVLL